MKTEAPHVRFAFAACLGLFVGLIWSPPAEAHTLGGRAFAAFVNAPTLGAGPFYLADSGELSPNGGWEGAGLLGSEVPYVLSASVLNSATSGADTGDGGQAGSSASLADVTVLPGHAAQLTAAFVRAQVAATDFGSSGAAEIHDLTLSGAPVLVTGQPNQRVEVPGLLGPVATLIINEQSVMSDGASQSITVNALRLTLATGEEVILGSARSLVNPVGSVTLASAEGDGTCWSNGNQARTALWRSDGPPPVVFAHVGGEQPQCIDFVTGGGFFEPPSSTRPGRVNFGFNAGPRSIQNQDLKGHLNLIDHDSRDHLKGISVDSYGPAGDPDHCRMFTGDAIFNGIPGHRYEAGVCDFGEPGRDDRFRVRVTLGPAEVYFADNEKDDFGPPPFSGELDGGNIQLHKPKCQKPAASGGMKSNLASEI